jgi:ribosomal protein S18 acetylase RimI-like enzyme
MAGMEANGKTGRTEEEAAAGFERAKSIMNVIPEHPRGAWIVENVATLPEFRRRGLIDRLSQEILKRGRARGAAVGDPEFESAYGTPGTRTLRRSL